MRNILVNNKTKIKNKNAETPIVLHTLTHVLCNLIDNDAIIVSKNNIEKGQQFTFVNCCPFVLYKKIPVRCRGKPHELLYEN